ncbi:uncharacterized protein MYCFIDRAFT_215491 [Pseudocercospora fijiensis CIRAD86]|uniref:F-box domain-containing protein n=1 Tax=Pseudocercospora fijiensis (strain CIRAD86) TaxID=383855 RepID=M3AB59_PSEFD|nr:uncharacterized protein MYCFIDRAFT_215491 [Pseudocercospora fijiensis CIRAD86]EME81811.1 hypothetical protein MYCFIDRAFT_215491 [Pseudocercospora fijiensis CIRAD86]
MRSVTSSRNARLAFVQYDPKTGEEKREWMASAQQELPIRRLKVPRGGFRRMATSPNAATRVFGITELLEHILIDVSPRDLIHLQLVSKNCKNTIDGSSILQRMIYPEPTDAKFAWVDQYRTRLLSRELLGSYIKDIVPVTDLTSRYPDDSFARSARFNELVLRKQSTDVWGSFAARVIGGEILVFNEKANQILFAHDQPLSCDKMFLTNIPISELELLVECDCNRTGGCSNHRSFRFVWNPEGFRVGWIREYVRGICSLVQSVRIRFAATDEHQNGVVFPTEAEADWVKEKLGIDI